MKIIPEQTRGCRLLNHVLAYKRMGFWKTQQNCFTHPRPALELTTPWACGPRRNVSLPFELQVRIASFIGQQHPALWHHTRELLQIGQQMEAICQGEGIWKGPTSAVFSIFATEVGLLVVVRLALTCRKQPQMAPSSSYIGLSAALQHYGR